MFFLREGGFRFLALGRVCCVGYFSGGCCLGRKGGGKGEVVVVVVVVVVWSLSRSIYPFFLSLCLYRPLSRTDQHSTPPPQLSTLPSKISYTTPGIRTAKGNAVTIPRRELFDIRMQLMAEDDDDDENLAFLASLGDDDIRTNVYEGGLKSWECSVDLVGVLVDDGGLWGSGGEGLRVMEVRFFWCWLISRGLSQRH
jgi:hypothetical protein